MNDQQHVRIDEDGGDLSLALLAAGNNAGTVGASILPPRMLDGDTAWELFRHGEPVFRVGKFVGVLFRRGDEDSGELGVYCPTTRKLALFEPGTLVNVALEAGIGEP